MTPTTLQILTGAGTFAVALGCCLRLTRWIDEHKTRTQACRLSQERLDTIALIKVAERFHRPRRALRDRLEQLTRDELAQSGMVSRGRK